MNSKGMLSRQHAQLIVEALTARAREGLSIVDAFNRLPMSARTYYRRKAKFPAVVAALEERATLEKREESLRQLRAKTQREAREILKDCIPSLVSIAYGEPEPMVNKTTGKVIRTYPRDVSAARRLLKSISKMGLVDDASLAAQDLL